LGIFASQDPVEGDIRNAVTLNRYAYVGGDPVNRADPWGLAFDDLIGTERPSCETCKFSESK
jgi:hypothetical protein